VKTIENAVFYPLISGSALLIILINRCFIQPHAKYFLKAHALFTSSFMEDFHDGSAKTNHLACQVRF